MEKRISEMHPEWRTSFPVHRSPFTALYYSLLNIIQSAIRFLSSAVCRLSSALRSPFPILHYSLLIIRQSAVCFLSSVVCRLSSAFRSPTTDYRSPITAIRSAFTLIELLVVIAIISILMAMLLPALSNAKEQARRILCLGNQKQVTMVAINYAESYNDNIPLGCWWGSWDRNTHIWREGMYYFVSGYPSDGPRYISFGLFIQAGLASNTDASFFCPSDKDPWTSLGGANNTWPIGKDSTKNTDSSYGNRPEYGDGNAVQWRSNLPSTFPKLRKLSNMALISDSFFTYSTVLARHKTGINACYSDGGARWIRIELIKSNLGLCTVRDNNMNQSDTYQKAIWYTIDANR